MRERDKSGLSGGGLLKIPLLFNLKIRIFFVCFMWQYRYDTLSAKNSILICLIKFSCTSFKSADSSVMILL